MNPHAPWAHYLRMAGYVESLDDFEPCEVAVGCRYCGADLGTFDESEAHYIETSGASGDYCPSCLAEPLWEPRDDDALERHEELAA